MNELEQTKTAMQRLVSVAVPAPDLTTEQFLAQGRGQARFYWADGRSQIRFAGFGSAANLTAWGSGRYRSIHKQAQRLFKQAYIHHGAAPVAAPRLFGGFSFRDDFIADNTWTAFRPAHFILPHYQFVSSVNGRWLTLNSLLPRSERVAHILPQLQEAVAARYALLTAAPPPQATLPNPVKSIRYPMTPAAWKQMIDSAVDEMHHTSLNKVVLSRVCEIRFARATDIDAALAFLDRNYANCYRFLFEPRPNHAFLGATPEQLAAVNGRQLHTMALAGSIQRGHDNASDDAYAQTLLNDPKNLHEHDLVVAAMRQRLAAIAVELTIAPQTGILKLSNIQHLYTPITARLHNPSGVLPIVAQLHPTPALGGSPRHKAMQFIQRAEPVPRGWYGAPVGWIDSQLDGQFGVAIRSAVAQDERIWLYAGAGIVADSVAELEWDETGLKFKPILEALGLETAVSTPV